MLRDYSDSDMGSFLSQSRFGQMCFVLISFIASYILKYLKPLKNKVKTFIGMNLIKIILKMLITSQTKDSHKLQIYTSPLTRNDETHSCSSEDIIASVNSKLKYKVDT